MIPAPPPPPHRDLHIIRNSINGFSVFQSTQMKSLSHTSVQNPPLHQYAPNLFFKLAADRLTPIQGKVYT